MTHIEAVCTRCKEVFIPHGLDPEEILHGETEAGTPCGGIGDVMGEHLIPGEAPRVTVKHEQYLDAAATHGWEKPDCDDPDCEFHHPEVREHKFEDSPEYIPPINPSY